MLEYLLASHASNSNRFTFPSWPPKLVGTDTQKSRIDKQVAPNRFGQKPSPMRRALAID
jgi:hypothetical protein